MPLFMFTFLHLCACVCVCMCGVYVYMCTTYHKFIFIPLIPIQFLIIHFSLSPLLICNYFSNIANFTFHFPKRRKMSIL